MSGKGKTNKRIIQVLKGIVVEACVCSILLCIMAGLLQKGNMTEKTVEPLLAASVFIVSLLGCLTAARGGANNHPILSAVPGLILLLFILMGRWITGSGKQGIAYILLLAVCSIVPPMIVVGSGRSVKRHR